MINHFTPSFLKSLLSKQGIRIQILMMSLFVLFLPNSARAQISCYQFNQTVGSYTTLSGGTTIASGTADDNVYSVGIGMTFVFNGTSYTNMTVSTNGYIAFGNTTNTNGSILSGVQNVISILGGDCQGNGSSSTISQHISGTAPNRVVTVQWANWGFWPSGSTGANCNYQIKLYEGSNAIELVYGSFSLSQTHTVAVGIRGSSATDFQVRSIAGNWANSTAGNNIGTTASLSSASYPQSGLRYSWSFATSLTAGFSLPDTAYTGTQVTMQNNNVLGFSNRWDINDDGSFEYTSIHAKHVFGAPGTYAIRLTSFSCTLRDSILKYIVIRNPTAAPVADFVSYSNKINKYDNAQMFDLSTNGATSWDWHIWSPLDSVNTVQTYSGSDPNMHMNPVFNMGVSGLYNVCLTTANSIGSSARVCKTAYIDVAEPTDIWMGPVTSTTSDSGYLFDNGGPGSNYGNNRFDYLAIKPCGAKSVTINFQTFKLGVGDNLQIYNGVSAGGPALHPAGGWTSTNPLPTNTNITANSGAMYILFQSNGSGVDSGFKAKWTTVKGPVTPPTAKFRKPDTIYNKVVTTLFNESENANGDVTYEWEVDGLLISSSKDFTTAWLTDGNYEVKLKVSTCMGSHTFTDTVYVRTPHTRTLLDFVASDRRPALGNTVQFTSTSDKANRFRWTVYPNTTASIANPTSANTNITFNAAGAYTITLRAWNDLDSAATVRTVIKDDYVIVTNYCQPFISVANSTDVGITNVTLKKGATTLIDNTTTSGAIGYNSYLSTHSATLTFGATYDITLSRGSNVNPMTRKVWIDFNIDGDFNDPGELVASEPMGTNMNFSASFTVPDISSSFTGNTIMRVAAAYGNMPNTACGPIAVGEYEDYRIILENDNKAPVLELLGDDTMYVEVGLPFTDPGAKATDPTEGDISSRILEVSDLDVTNTGIYTIVYSVSDASGNAAPSLTRVIYVVADRTVPVLTLIGSDTITIEVDSAYTEQGATATDNKDGNLTTAIVLTGTVDNTTVGTYVIVYTVADAQGNTATRSRVVRVRDTQAPVILAIGSENVQIGTSFFDQTIVSDNYDDVVTLVKTGATVNPLVPGIYTITYTAKDAAGNEATPVVRNYRVDDFTLPVIDLNTEDTIYIDVNPGTPYKSVEPEVSDAYYSSDVITVNKTHNVNAYELGLYTETYTATDPSGNVSTKTRYVRVVDRVAPTIFANTIHVKRYTNFNPMAGLILKDNYYSPVILLPLVKVLTHNVNIYEVGIYSITYQVTDPSGNVSAPFTRLVIVTEDAIALGIEDLASKGFVVYPNPASDLVNVVVKAELTVQSVKIFNMSGQMVREMSGSDLKAASNQVSVSELPAGMYVISLIDSNGMLYNHKVNIQK